MNLYSGIGGNRKLWKEVDVTAVELNPEIAKIYQDFFPEDEVIVADAHQYLLDHYKEFDFIWSSPPCPSHSIARFWGSHREDTKEIYPDMALYQEIIFLTSYMKNKWVVENVKPYYKPLIYPKGQIGRHYFWANFHIPTIGLDSDYPKDSILDLQKRTGFDLSNCKVKDKQKLLRNCVLPNFGNYILNCARNHTEPIQEGLFEIN